MNRGRRAAASRDHASLPRMSGRGGRAHAYVFASRVEIVSRRHGVDYGRLLGVVLAHEAGRVLMGGRLSERARAPEWPTPSRRQR